MQQIYQISHHSATDAQPAGWYWIADWSKSGGGPFRGDWEAQIALSQAAAKIYENGLCPFCGQKARDQNYRAKSRTVKGIGHAPIVVPEGYTVELACTSCNKTTKLEVQEL